MAVIKSSDGTTEVLVDDDDVERLSLGRWYPHRRNGLVRYACGRVNGRRVLMHRYLMGEAVLAGGLQVDHINGNGLDNRKANLRAATHSQNQANIGKRIKGTTSRFVGVSWHAGTQRWRAQLRYGGTNMNLGLSPTEEAAAHIYDTHSREHHGEFARCNYPTHEHGEILSALSIHWLTTGLPWANDRLLVVPDYYHGVTEVGLIGRLIA